MGLHTASAYNDGTCLTDRQAPIFYWLRRTCLQPASLQKTSRLRKLTYIGVSLVIKLLIG